jgi:hypothetical protein
MTKPIIELSNSSCNQISSCARKYQIRKRFKHSESNYDTGLPAMGGTAIHGYIQDIMSGLTQEEAEINFFFNWDFNIEAEDSEWNRKERGMEACFRSAKFAVTELGLNPNQIAMINLQGHETPAVEVKFNIIISSANWINEYHYRGSIDLITYSQHHDNYTVYDIKTHRDTSTVPIIYKYKYDTQTIPYGLVIAQITGKSINNFQAHYMPVFVDIDKPRAEVIHFTRTEKDVKHWVDSIHRQITQIEQFANDQVWPRSTTGCDAYRKPCAFFKYCDIEEHYPLQLALLKFGEAKEPKPFGEVVTINLELN